MSKTLKDTVDLMLSYKFEERLEAECAQLDIRLEGLTKFINSEKFNSVSPTQRSLLKIQAQVMNLYLEIISARVIDLGIATKAKDEN